MVKHLGYCTECGSSITEIDIMPIEVSDLYECPECHHPHALSDMWDEVPDYLK